MYLKSRSDNFHLIKLILCCLGEKMEKSDSNLSEPKLGFVVFFDFDSIRERDTDIDPPPPRCTPYEQGFIFVVQLVENGFICMTFVAGNESSQFID